MRVNVAIQVERVGAYKIKIEKGDEKELSKEVIVEVQNVPTIAPQRPH
jgi:hypothetical protein